jgi:hypothetical protein
MIHNISSETLLQEALVQVQKPTEVLGTHGSKYLLKWNGDRLESAQITGLALRGAQVKIDQANYFLAHGYPINKALLAATFRPGAPEPQHESEEQAPVSAEQPVIVGEAQTDMPELNAWVAENKSKLDELLTHYGISTIDSLLVSMLKDRIGDMLNDVPSNEDPNVDIRA